MATSNEPRTNWGDAQKHYDRAYELMTRALALDERGVIQQAVTLYQRGLAAFNDATASASTIAASSAGQAATNAMSTLLTQISAAKTLIERRLKELSALPFDDSATSQDTTEADELLSILDGAQLYYISPSGSAGAALEIPRLAIYRLRNASKTTQQVELPPSTTFLQVGEWSYPLVGTPVLRASWGAYIFPDPMADEPGSTVGVVLLDSVSEQDKQKFEEILQGCSQLKIQEEEKKPVHTAKRISQGIERVATWIADRMTSGAEKTGGYLAKGSAKVRESMQPNEDMTQVNQYALTGVYYTRRATGVAVNVSNELVSRLGQALMLLGKKVAPIVKEKGSQYLPSALKSPSASGAPSAVDNVTEVAAGSIRGVVTIFGGLERAAQILATSLVNETVNVVEHKYGPSMGDLAKNALSSALNVGYTVYNMAAFRPRSLLKRTVKGTGAGIVTELAEEANASNNATESRMGNKNGVDRNAGPPERPPPPYCRAVDSDASLSDRPPPYNPAAGGTGGGHNYPLEKPPCN